MSCLINIQTQNSRNGAPYTVHHVKVTGSISSSNKKLIRPATKTVSTSGWQHKHTYIHNIIYIHTYIHTYIQMALITIDTWHRHQRNTASFH